MATLAELEGALVKADQAGNADDARAFASEIRRMRSAPQDQTQDTSLMQDVAQGAGNVLAGAVRGAGSIGATILSPLDYSGITGMTNEERRAKIDEGLRSMGAQPESLLYKGGKLGAEIAGTVGAGGVLARGLSSVPSVAAAAPGFIQAVRSGGMVADGAGLGVRAAGGALTGGAMAGMVNPEDAATGALIGGVLPIGVKAAGEVGKYIGGKISGPAVSEDMRQAVQAARDAGYVIPPTQAKPTLLNRALEGFAGKITTAQNASARNQAVTNEKVRQAIGASELSPAGLAEVRQTANQAYDAIGSVGKFNADNAFQRALDQAGASSIQMQKNFPELVNKDVDALITGLKGRGEFDAQSTIEAIKQFRADASTNKIALDPAKKALGRAQAKIAGALEDLVERNLTQAGNPELLTNYRNARQILAKTYDVEKALNPTTGNIDAGKLAASLKKGRPMTGELRDVAEFASRFPKASQTVEKMGSLPQLSPLDFGTAAITGSAMGPIGLAGLIARPAARSLTLSDLVQNRLSSGNSKNALVELMQNPELQRLMYRSAPVMGAQ